jgi:uncharacterized protein
VTIVHLGYQNMQIALDKGPGSHIDAYVPGQVTVNGMVYSSSVIVSAQGVSVWDVITLQNLTQTQLQPLIAPGLEIIIIGCGAVQEFMEPCLQAWISQHGVGIEVMTTAAACRTYNVLNAEHRKVTVGLIV